MNIELKTSVWTKKDWQPIIGMLITHEMLLGCIAIVVHLMNQRMFLTVMLGLMLLPLIPAFISYRIWYKRSHVRFEAV